MKREIVRYVSECDTCRKVKTDYMKHGGLLQPLAIPDWKLDDISRDFIVGFVGGHKIHIFTANIPIFHSKYRRYVLITNEFHKFC
jgi:hypothetical protein